ncbi:MAG: hypothetical protein L6R42_004470 [Xanthoria sp. 1 TBL-2021]|nr:MAG: hypothetical protein L6R42_004470 [Xanthoria sp. 1 TBL-2021]
METAKKAVNGDDTDNCKSVAGKITVLDNLLGVADNINYAKEAVFKKVAEDNTDTNLESKWNGYLKALDRYLGDFKSKVETTADNAGAELKKITDEDPVGTYFSSFCKSKYKEGRDYVQAQMEKQRADERSSRTTTCDCNENGCTPESLPCCFNETCDRDVWS